jgi:hypothetical protein
MGFGDSENCCSSNWGTLSAAEIERADDNGEISACIEYATIGFEVICFGGFSVAAEEEEFCAIETNSVSSAADALAHFFGKFDISADGDAFSIDGFGWESFDLSEAFADALVAGLGVADSGRENRSRGRSGFGRDRHRGLRFHHRRFC